MVIKKQLCRGERNESSEPTPLRFGSWSGLRDGGREWSPQSLGAQTSDHSLIKKEDGMRQNVTLIDFQATRSSSAATVE